MIAIELTGAERLQFSHILPVQGTLKVLEQVEQILAKAKVDVSKDLNETKTIEFDESEIEFIKSMISILDSQGQLMFESLSLIRKLIKGEN